MINIMHGDCMDLMEDKPDNYWDLAIVDPPYGIKRSKAKLSMSVNKSRNNGIKQKRNHHKVKDWDNNAPDPSYFDLLKMKTKHQIIWGANHFLDNMPFNINSSCWIIWNKINTIPTYADGEMAWTNFDKPMQIVPLKHSGFRRGQTIGEQSPVIYNIPFSGKMDIHPTQKPIALYKWLLKNYAKEGDKILDTHGGSMSSAIACHDMKFDLDIIELDKDYYEAGKKRFDNHIKQLTLF